MLVTELPKTALPALILPNVLIVATLFVTDALLANTNSACYFLAPNDASILKVSQRFGIKMKRIIVKFKPLDFKYKDKLYVISLIDRFILDDKKWSRDYLLKTLLD